MRFRSQHQIPALVCRSWRAANRLLETLLYAVTPTDGPTLAFVTALLLVITAIASLAPAWTSARVDPVVALRSD